MPTPVLEIDQLTKRYPKLTALDSINLTIPAGEIFALLGPNGAGKTTLIATVCGTAKKTSGRIKLFGIDLDLDPIKPRYDVGLVPQEINFDPFFSVREALRIQQGYYGRPRDDARIDEVLSALNLLSKADSQTRSLSGGMKRRLLIAKALVHRPKLVFLDEPTAGVDVELRRDLWAYVRTLRSQGTTVVLTTHYLEEAEELADRVGIIDGGKLLLVENKSTLMKRLGERHLEVRFSSPVTQIPVGAMHSQAMLCEEGKLFRYLERYDGPPAATLLAALYAAQLPISDVAIKPARLEDILLHVLHNGAITAEAQS